MRKLVIFIIACQSIQYYCLKGRLDCLSPKKHHFQNIALQKEGGVHTPLLQEKGGTCTPRTPLSGRPCPLDETQASDPKSGEKIVT